MSRSLCKGVPSRRYDNLGLTTGRGQGTFKKCDLKRVIEGVRAAGEKICRVEVGKDGKIVVVLGGPNANGPLVEEIVDDDTWDQ